MGGEDDMIIKPSLTVMNYYTRKLPLALALLANAFLETRIGLFGLCCNVFMLPLGRVWPHGSA
jgi:hypothetical protein